MVELSIIIVNYNVKYFLEHCLNSVLDATQTIDSEILVVDNKSSDGSVEYLRPRFPKVTFIVNDENVGFSKANNQALKMAKGRYVLLLNPDTLVQPDTFNRCIEFMDSHPKAGAVGVKMIDGKGLFLPESKRALPTPFVAFCKVFGLSSLFPYSKTFGRYHLGYLPNNQEHVVEVLSGAYMFIRKEILNKTGFLDESFFMYGEDIDLSYRISTSGLCNYYFPGTSIVHFKGESTKKRSINYVIVFYKAMKIFASKHFLGKGVSIYNTAINLAIYLRATASIIRRVFLKLLPETTKKANLWSHFSSILIVGNTAETNRVYELVKQLNSNAIITQISVKPGEDTTQIVNHHTINTLNPACIISCTKDINITQLMGVMELISNTTLSHAIIAPECAEIVLIK
jgi:GT2 family glycosyltransferase